MGENVITIKDLKKVYGLQNAVNGLNLNVPKGSVYGFLGRNGAGKTTTIKILLGLLSAKSGEVNVLGYNPKNEKEAVEIRKRTGYVSENQKMYDNMKIKEIISFTKSFYKTWDDKLAAEFLKRFNLDEKKKLSELSRGMYAQVALLLALAFKPELLVLDEPTGSLDAIVRRDFLESVVSLIQEEGRTVFFSSHQINEVERVSDWVGIIEAGKLLVSAPIDELKTKTKRIRSVFKEKAPEVNFGGIICKKADGRELVTIVENFGEEILSKIKKEKPESLDVYDMNLEEIFVAYAGGRI
ncbi:MAG: hypothetical protein A2231_12860 [Candidatus Firestonebacteria bacterium RIFOXYA2_FULL_40_8]|nr:MAG: hypothetical protein A2231_12860 [Candidatus Firestonebacteria bacterium RIFOXYA2_FULL_40_8]